MKISIVAVILIGFCSCLQIASTPQGQLKVSLEKLKSERSLKGIQVQLTKNQQIVFNLNLGQKNQKNEPINNETVFRIASVSKSFSSVALMQLVERNKLSLNKTLSELFGYEIKNPNYPEVDITVEMILSHQSSILECDPYYSNFIQETYNAKSGFEVPNIRQILVKGGKFYNQCVFSKTYKPGQHFQYTNLNYGIAGTIVQIISGLRFDIYQQQNILTHLNGGTKENCTFNAANITNPNNLGVIFTGKNGQWQPNFDNHSSGAIPARNLTGYKIGSNGVVYSPQGGLRASVTHLSNYAMLLANKGRTKAGKVVFSESSANQLLKPRYQYHGAQSGSANDFHLYGLGLFATTFRTNDKIIDHQVVRGHTGAAYGLISGQHFWGGFTLTYIINGALNGYKYGTGTIYEYQRLSIHSAVNNFAKNLEEQEPKLEMIQ